MVHSGKSIILILLFLASAVCLVFVHFFWQPDGLMEFVPDKKIFYLHFDLNPVRRAGKIGNERLGSEEIHAFLQKLLAGNANLPLVEDILQNREYFDEVGVVGLETPGKKGINLIFFLKTRKWTELPSFSGQTEGFEMENLSRRITAVFLKQVFENDVMPENHAEVFKNELSLSQKLVFPWIKGFYFGERRGSGGPEMRVNCFSFSNSSDLFFSLETAFQGDVFNVPSLAETGMRFGREYVLSFLRQGSLEEFENRIKTRMAFENPDGKTVFLPDGTNFIDQVVDPGAYFFVDKRTDGLETRKLASGQQDVPDVFLYQDHDYFYISNQSHLLKAARGLLDFAGQEGLIKGVYLSVSDMGIRDLTIVETPESVKGVLRF